MEQKEGLPRKPGVYPFDYPIERLLTEAPTPGVPRTVAELPRRNSLPSGGRPTVMAAEKTEGKKMVNESLMKRARKSDIQQAPMVTEFPEMTVKVPKFKQRTYQYPSGNPTGLAHFPPFEAQLLKLSKETT